MLPLRKFQLRRVQIIYCCKINYPYGEQCPNAWDWGDCWDMMFSFKMEKSRMNRVKQVSINSSHISGAWSKNVLLFLKRLASSSAGFPWAFSWSYIQVEGHLGPFDHQSLIQVGFFRAWWAVSSVGPQGQGQAGHRLFPSFTFAPVL